MRKKWQIAFIGTLPLLLAVAYPAPIFHKLGSMIVLDSTPNHSDAVVVLFSGTEFYPRLAQAADLFKKGLVDTVVINGNRKTDFIRELESKGYQPGQPWYENYVRVLVLMGVPRGNVIPISAEDAYDTISEAQAVGPEIIRRGFKKILITTSKFHTRRAAFIWQNQYADHLEIQTVAAKSDPYDPAGWWKNGRQIRWVLSEYGAWVYYWWKRLTGL